MKKLSRRTIVNRIKRGGTLCPTCGCTHSKYIYHDVGYPEVFDQRFCSGCGALLGFSDNSPHFEICEIIRERLNHVTYKGCQTIADEFNNMYL